MAFAPDLYHGKVVDTIAEADVISRSVFENLDQVRTDVRDAAAYLKELADQATGGLAVIGFSLGAFFALDLSVMAPETTQAVVAFYGTRPGDYSNSKAAYLCHFAETDEFEPPSEVAGLEDALRSANRPAKFYHYSGTGHWFFEPDRLQAYNPAAASLAWTRTLAFLQSSFSRETTE